MMHDIQNFENTGQPLNSDQSLNPDMLKLARESRGLTQIELCEKMGIRQGTISKIENQMLPFSQEIADRAAIALEYPVKFFQRKNSSHALSVTYYRRNLSLSAKVLQQVEARLDIARMSIEQMIDSVDCPDPNIFAWDVEKHGEPERAARTLRERWRVPKGPLRKLIELIEDNGVLVIAFDFGLDEVDGFAVRGAHNRPIIFFNRNHTGDRRRMTIAHELGHLIMHIGQVVPESRDEEDEAFRFATEFLVPEVEFNQTFSKLSLSALASMKQYWHVSMRSLIYKVERRNKISSNQARYLWQQMAKNNYIKKEPPLLDIPLEEPLLLKEVIEVHQTELDYKMDEIAQMVALTPKEFMQVFFGEKKPLFSVIRNPDFTLHTDKKNFFRPSYD